MGFKFTDEKRALMAKALASKTAYQVGIDFGLDKHYKNANTVSAIVTRNWYKVRNEPEKYALSPDLIETVSTAMQERGLANRQGKLRVTHKEAVDKMLTEKIENLAVNNRQKAWALLSLRLDDLLSTRRKREKVSIGEIAKVAAIAFDKGQLIEGKATEHVAMLAKIDGDMSPQEMIEMTMKMREYNNSVNEEKKQ